MRMPPKPRLTLRNLFFCFSSDPGFRGQWRVAHMRALADPLSQRKKKKARMWVVVFALGRKASSCWVGWSHDMMPAHVFGVSGHFSHSVALLSHYPDLFTILLRFSILLRCHWLGFHSAPLPLPPTGQAQQYAPSNIRQTPSPPADDDDDWGCEEQLPVYEEGEVRLRRGA